MFWRMCVKNYKSENYDLTKEDQSYNKNSFHKCLKNPVGIKISK